MVQFDSKKEKWAFCSFLFDELSYILWEQECSGAIDNPHECCGVRTKMIYKLVTRYEKRSNDEEVS